MCFVAFSSRWIQVFVGAFDLLISLRDDQAVKMELDKILAHTVGQAMTKTTTVTTPQTTLSLAAKTMLQAKVRSCAHRGLSCVGYVSRMNPLVSCWGSIVACMCTCMIFVSCQ
jgi:hypothetical protein